MPKPLGIDQYEPSNPLRVEDRWAWDELRRISDLTAEMIRYIKDLETELAALETRVATLEAGA